jgi:ketol-acid reductoisomerase
MMNDGMKIILERLKTHPEEFTDDSNPFASEGKWTKLIHQYQHNLAKEDMDAFKSAIDEIRQTEFTAKVMEELLDPKPLELEDVIKQYRATGISSVGQTLASSLTTSKPWVTAGVLTANSNTLTIGNQTLDAETIEHMKAHLDYIRKQEVQEAKKKATPR